jgi:hypothetical protein
MEMERRRNKVMQIVNCKMQIANLKWGGIEQMNFFWPRRLRLGIERQQTSFFYYAPFRGILGKGKSIDHLIPSRKRLG